MQSLPTRRAFVGIALALLVALGAFVLWPKNQENAVSPPEDTAGDTMWAPETNTALEENSDVTLEPADAAGTETELVAGAETDENVAATDSDVIAVYTVQEGDTLSAIAAQFYDGDTTWYGLIEEANALANPSDIKAGDKLKIPQKPEPQKDSPKADSPKSDQQKAGDTQNDTQKSDDTQKNQEQPDQSKNDDR